MTSEQAAAAAAEIAAAWEECPSIEEARYVTHLWAWSEATDEERRRATEKFGDEY